MIILQEAGPIRDYHQAKVLYVKLHYAHIIKLWCGTTILWKTLTYHLLKTLVARNKTTDGYK